MIAVNLMLLLLCGNIKRQVRCLSHSFAQHAHTHTDTLNIIMIARFSALDKAPKLKTYR